MQERRNSSALIVELRLSCTNSSILWRHVTGALSELLTFCEGNPPVSDVFPSQKVDDAMYIVVPKSNHAVPNN